LKYKTILADPPWQYRNDGVDGAAQKHYPTMKTEDIAQMEIDKICENDCVLILWATWPCLTDAFEVIRGWGFNYVTGFPWIKVRGIPTTNLWGETEINAGWGMGFWIHGISELVLICRRGKPKLPTKRWVGLLSPNIRHSKKPKSIYEFAETLEPPYIELFARNKREGWDVFGNEVESDIQLIGEKVL